MARFLDVGMVRVQTYLGRWPSLRGRRAASAMIVNAFDPTSLGSIIDGRASTNDAAGHADGKVSLVVADGDDALVEQLARDILADLRRRLPAAEFEATWADADHYTAAYPTIQAKRQRGEAIVSRPVTAVFPAARPCDLCGQWPATGEVAGVGTDRSSRPKAACHDCALRFDHQADRPANARPASARLATELDQELATDFEALARCGDPRRKQNHLATIFADGNAFGEFFKELTRSDPAMINDVSVRIGKHAEEALIHAATVVRGEGRIARVQVHVLGGDDVLVTVPASIGWDFTLAYLTDFERRVRETCELAGAGLMVPTASAGVVFAQASFPFGQVVDIADALLSKAKAKVAGAASSVAWIDVTSRGDDPAAALESWTLAEIDERSGLLDQLAALDASTAARLAQQLGDHSDEHGAVKARATLRRHGHDELYDEFDELGATTFEACLDLASWWGVER